MRLLIDTHVWLWSLAEPARLSKQARSLLENVDNEVLFSVVCSWEIVTKHSLGKLKLPEPPDAFIPEQLKVQRLAALPLTLQHTLEAARLPWHHRDPFDRMLIAQARCERIPFLTADRKILAYEVKTIWAGATPKPVADRKPAAGAARRRRRARTA